MNNNVLNPDIHVLGDQHCSKTTVNTMFSEGNVLIQVQRQSSQHYSVLNVNAFMFEKIGHSPHTTVNTMFSEHTDTSSE